MSKFFDHVFLLRPVLLPPVWTVFLLGYHRSVLQGGQKSSIVTSFILLTLLSGAIYILNQIYDAESDRANRKLFLLADNLIPKRDAAIEAVLLGVLGILPAYVLSTGLGILFTLGAALGFVYSVPPLALKNRPLGGLLSNALGHGSLVFLMGWCTNLPLSTKGIICSVPYLLAVGAIYLNTTIPDKAGDIKTGKVTLATKWGESSTKLFSTFLVFVALVYSLVLKDYPFSLVAFLSMPFFIYMLFSHERRRVILATKIAVVCLSILTGVFYMWYFILLLLVYIISRIYYKWRFGISYPSLFGK